MAESIPLQQFKKDQQRVVELLTEIFPDACPKYIRKKSEELVCDSGKLNHFICSSLEHKNYPKINDEQNQVVPTALKIDYTVESFVEKFKEPKKIFSERNVGEHFVSDSLKYLQVKFPYSKCEEITRVLNEKNFNLYLTAKDLITRTHTRKTKRSTSLELSYKTLRQDFYDEMYYLKHEEEVNAYIAEKEEKESKYLALRKIQLEVAKATGEILECQCCFSDEYFTHEMVQCSEGHISCRDCVKKSTEINIGEEKFQFPCICCSDCPGVFPLETLESIIAPTLYRRLLDKIQEKEVLEAKIPGLEVCPFCEYAEIPPEDDKLFRCKRCCQDSCRSCKGNSHLPYSCAEFKESKAQNARLYVEEKMTEALLRTCWKCNAKFVKKDGCNKMTCHCGAKMCYICQKPVVDYNHFFNPKHEEENTKKLCPLYSCNKVVHYETVKNAAKKAKLEMEHENQFQEEDFLLGLVPEA